MKLSLKNRFSFGAAHLFTGQTLRFCSSVRSLLYRKLKNVPCAYNDRYFREANSTRHENCSDKFFRSSHYMKCCKLSDQEFGND